MKVLILGASGMAGHVIYKFLSEQKDLEVMGTTNSTFLNNHCIPLNVFDTKKVEETINNFNPKVIINCIGSLIKESKSSPERAIFCNAFLPYFLKKCCQKNNIKLIHISTDCVFSGKVGGYTEDSTKDASDIYGMSKSLGEINDEVN